MGISLLNIVSVKRLVDKKIVINVMILNLKNQQKFLIEQYAEKMYIGKYNSLC